MRAKAVLFDKDGTLFDFQKSWSRWIGDEIIRLAGGDLALAQDVADAIGYDLQNALILPHSPAIAGTSRDVAQVLLPFAPGETLSGLQTTLDANAAELTPVEVLPLGPFADSLLAMGLTLGLATNDNETSARRHMAKFDLLDRFSFVAGYDSGHGAKPGPGMCNAFVAHCGVDPRHSVMVGDSLHDLHAGRSAGMQTVAVLTGVATADDLQDHADVVLPDIGHLAAWLSDSII